MHDRLLEFGSSAALRAPLDAALGQMSPALEQAGIHSVLLKGPTVAGWLYDPGETRAYSDIDLLIDERQLTEAENILRGLDFELRAEPQPVLWIDRHHRVWERAGDAVAVELHWTLVGTGVPSGEAWRVLSQQTERMVVGGAQIDALSPPARALGLALHFTVHSGAAQTCEDLERGIARLELHVWEAARDLAAQLDAMSAFAAGLRACPGGLALATRLRLPEPFIYWDLRASAAPETAGRSWYLRHAPTLRDRWRLVVWFLPQTRGDLGAGGPLARVGDLARAAAAVLRRLRGALAGP